MTLLHEIKEANKLFLAQTPRLLEPSGEPFIVIACIDSRLTNLLEPALGLPRHRATVIRIAGNTILDKDFVTLRSVAAGLFVKHCKEIMVVGHTDCGMAKFSSPEVIESFRAAGISRKAFGDEDLRTWFGAFSDIKKNVIESILNLRKSGLVPAGTKIHGIILDTEKGEIEIAVDGDSAPIEPTESAHQPAASEVREEAKESSVTISAGSPAAPQLPSAGSKRPVVIGERQTEHKATPGASQPDSVVDAVLVIRDFLARERQDAKFQKTLAEIGALLNRERDPAKILAALEKTVESYEDRYPKLPGAIEYLKKSLETRETTGHGFIDMMKRLFVEAQKQQLYKGQK